MLLQGGVFFPRPFIQPHIGKLSDVLQIEPQQASFARRATVDDDLFVWFQPGRFEFGFHLREGFELVGVVFLHQPSPMEADRTRDMTLSQPDVVVADVLIVGASIDEHDAGYSLSCQQIIDCNRNLFVSLLGQRPRSIAKVFLRHGQLGLCPGRKTTVNDANVLHTKLFQYVGDHAGAQDFIVGKHIACRIDQMGAIAIDAGSNQQCFGDVVRQILDWNAILGAAKRIEVEMMRGGKVAAEVVLVASASIHNDGPLAGVLILNELIGIGRRNDTDLRSGNIGNEQQREGSDESFHG